MILEDWRDASADVVQGLYDAERRRWEARLHWDPAPALAVLEDARQAGLVAGWIARDADGAALGWTYYLLHDGLLQIGGLVASRPSVARRLIDAALESPEAALARGWSGFLFPESDSIRSALTRQRFLLRETVYLTRQLDRDCGDAGRVTAVRGWLDDDFASGVRILAAAYAGEPAAAAFAPDGRREQWAAYAWQLLRTPGCGRFDPALSAVAVGKDGLPRGLAMTTWIARGTVHVAQIAVLPEARRAGLGEALLRSVARLARAAGARRLTLMVDERNAAARGLYERLGFVEEARLVFASRAARNRVAA